MNLSTVRSSIAALASLSAAPLAAQVQSDAREAAAVESGTHPLLWLALLTLAIVVGFALWQRSRVAKAKQNNDHSSLSQGHGDAEARRRNKPR